MKKKLLLFALAAITGGFMLSSAASAQIASTAENFTLTIDSAYRWFINPAANDFGGITSADFNATVNNTGTSTTHQIVVGDGTVDAQASDSYMETNSEAQADLQTYNLTVGDYAGSTATFSDANTINVTDVEGGANIDVNFLIRNSAFGGNSTFGGQNWTASTATVSTIGPVALTYADPEGAGASAAAIDMGLDFDESTLGYDDVVGAADQQIGFSLTFTVLAVD